MFTRGTTWDGTLEFEVDDVIAATGFQTPLADLPQLGLVTVADGRIPALTPFWESVSLPGVFFAGNASQGARGIGKHGAGASSSVGERLPLQRPCARPSPGGTARRPRACAHAGGRSWCRSCCGELTAAPELWVQKGYLCRVVSAEDGSYLDEGVVPLSSFLDAAGPDALAANVEVDEAGKIIPMLYVRRGGDVLEHQLEPHPLHEYEGERYRNYVSGLVS